MYRGAELQAAVEQNFSFLDNTSTAGSVSRGTSHRQNAGVAQVGTWNDRQRPASTRQNRQVKYWEPRFKSVRDMPDFVPEKTLPRSMDWQQRRIQEEKIAMVRQKEWEREKMRREEERRSVERREMERVREEHWRQVEKMKEQERQRQMEEEWRFREEERQKALARELEEEMREKERVEERMRYLEADRGRRQNEEVYVRRWKVHPAQKVTEDRPEEAKGAERTRHWDVHPSASDDHLKHWKEGLKQNQLQESVKGPPIGNYVAPPRAPNNVQVSRNSVQNHSNEGNTNGSDGSSLLKRTKHYLDAIDRMHSRDKQENGDIQKVHEPRRVETAVGPPSNVPKPPDMSGFETFKRSQNGKIDGRFIAERIKDLKDVDLSAPPPPPMPAAHPASYQNTTPNLQAVQSAKSALRPIDKRTIEDKTYEPEPKTFKEKLDRLLAFQLANQRHLSKPPVTAEPPPENSGPSFRGGVDMEEKRDAVAARYREKQRDDVKVVRRTASTNRKSILPGQENGHRGGGGHRWRQSDIPAQAR